MKSIRFAYAVFTILVLSVIINSFAVGRTISIISDELSTVSDSDIQAAKSEYAAIYEKYQRYELYISLSVDHDDLSNVEDAFAEIIGAATAGDRDGVITTKSRLTDYLRHIKRLSGINIDSIF